MKKNKNNGLYIGKKAGYDKLIDSINNAKYNIKIVSPFLSMKLVNDLIEKTKNSNITIGIITENNYNNNLIIEKLKYLKNKKIYIKVYNSQN